MGKQGTSQEGEWWWNPESGLERFQVASNPVGQGETLQGWPQGQGWCPMGEAVPRGTAAQEES